MKSRPDTRLLPHLHELFLSVALGVLLGTTLTMNTGDPVTPGAVNTQETLQYSSPEDSAPWSIPETTTLERIACTLPWADNLEHISPAPTIVLRPPTIRKPTPQPTVRPYYAKYVPVPRGASPNSVVLTHAQSPLPVSAKRSGGKYVCARKNDRGHKSNKNRRAHIDRQCCLDPDEVPNPHCTY